MAAVTIKGNRVARKRLWNMNPVLSVFQWSFAHNLHNLQDWSQPWKKLEIRLEFSTHNDSYLIEKEDIFGVLQDSNIGSGIASVEIRSNIVFWLYFNCLKDLFYADWESWSRPVDSRIGSANLVVKASPETMGTGQIRSLGSSIWRAPIRAAVTATQGGADQQGEVVALSGKELGDEVRRTPRGFRLWRQMKELNNLVKRDIGQQIQATHDEEPPGKFGNQSQDLV